jgi:MOSC domain-containing protein YiiM
MPFSPQEPSQALIFQINRSNGGVPKLAVQSGFISAAGLQGDSHRDLVHHGGPERAVCLYALECILALQAEGHPIFPGSAGENITLRGLDWSQVTPGRQLRLGNRVVLEVTRYTEPCNNIRASFQGGNMIRMAQNHYPGWSRVYARVLAEGEIITGDPVVLV